MDDTVNNLLTAIQPNGIERQEAREQVAMIANVRLPKEYSGGYKDSLTTRSIFETLGIKVLGKGTKTYRRSSPPFFLAWKVS